MIVGTAGHIDHGKTSLVRALTGVETDRLKEEKARGISIDLGFAYWRQSDGTTVGFVDMPGHEALVHNMLAGATGIDVVLLVVAADDGVMPQTREHLAIVSLLGLTRGVVALNKADRVDPARLAEVTQQIRAELAQSPFPEAPIIPVSAVTGAGVDTLSATLLAAGAMDRATRANHLFRLAVDRSFTLKGHGTAITGLVVSGAVSVGDDVIISPSGLQARVRSMHAQNVSAQRGVAGQRCALVLVGAGVEKEVIHRGDTVVEPELHAPTTRIDADLRILAAEQKPIPAWFPVTFHHGAAAMPARIVPLAPEQLQPGQTGLAQIVLERPLAIYNGDRFVVRDTTSSRTIGGGVALDVRAPERRRRTQERLAALAAMKTPSDADVISALLTLPPLWLNAGTFLRDRAMAASRLPDICHQLDAEHLATPEGTVLIGTPAWQALVVSVGTCLDRHHAEHPDQPGMARERLRALAPLRCPVALFNAVLERLALDQQIVLDRSWVRRPSHQVRFSEQEEDLWRHIWPRLIKEPYRPPRVRDIAKAMDIDEALVRRLFKLAQRRGDVEEVAQDHFFTRAVVERMAAIALDCAASHPKGEFSAADLRDRLDNGRKVAIQILEFFDRHGFTMRRKDLRRINPHRADLFVPRPAVIQPNANGIGGVPLPVGRPDFKSGWGCQTVPGGFDSHPPPPTSEKRGA